MPMPKFINATQVHGEWWVILKDGENIFSVFLNANGKVVDREVVL